MKVLFALLGVVLVATLVAAQSQPPCIGYTYCQECQEDPICGWCSLGSGKCVEGNATDPLIGTCANGWYYTSCPISPGYFFFENQFAGYTNCDTRTNGCYYLYPSYCCSSSPCWTTAQNVIFQDQTPKNGQPTGLSFSLYGHLYCPDNSPLYAYVYLNSYYLGAIYSSPESTSTCMCKDECDAPISFTYTLPEGYTWYNYYLGANNTLNLYVSEGSTCVGKLFGEVTYGPAPPLAEPLKKLPKLTEEEVARKQQEDLAKAKEAFAAKRAAAAVEAKN